MKTFLENVAQSLLGKFGSNLSEVTVVFPGKRASLFLNQALAEQSPTPVWAPRYQTISELFQQVSSFALSDPIETVCRLYAVYTRFFDDALPLDRFWSWGEILLSDFDDIDKHLVDASQLFHNIADLQALDDNSYITPEQEEALRSFFHHFSLEENSNIKTQFLRLWNRMNDIYDGLQEVLRRENILYEGALQRDVILGLRSARLSGDNSVSSKFGDRTFVFVGFNVLNDVEQALFDELQARNQALFYWDYDVFYTEQNHEAGYFLRQNLQRYGNELSPDCFDNLRKPKEITFITATSENAQARYIPQWLATEQTEQENRTAVVLCNEDLLQPVLHSIPSAVEGAPAAVNITMGFPLAGTPVFSFVLSLINLQTNGYDPARQRFNHSLLKSVEQHPFARLIPDDLWHHPAGEGTALLDYLLEILSALAPHFSEESIYNQLYAESLFKSFTALSRLRDLMTMSISSEAGDEAVPLLSVNDHTLRRLLRSILQSQSVPFHGEPASGLQVLGVLETRALDFDHLLMLSVGEGYLPKTVSDTSLIPYNLREAFGLTTVRHKIAVYAYYFYRLIQRASHVTFVYNESNAGIRQNEISRFLRQLLAETDFPIHSLRIEAPTKVIDPQPIVIEKTPEIIHWLHQTYDQRCAVEGKKTSVLSPTAINKYTTCPLSFYYSYVQNLRIESDPQDGLDAQLFGNIFHKAAELVYKQLTSAGKVIRRQDIEPFLENDGHRLEPFIQQAFKDQFFHDNPEDYSGILIIAVRVLRSYLLQLLRHDLRLTPFTLVDTEKWVEMTLDFEGMRIRTGGIIDRIDQINDPEVEGGIAVRVVDYKTGSYPSAVPELQRLFHEAGQREHYFLQTILYATIMAQRQSLPVTPCLFYVHKSGSEDYSPKLRLSRQLLHDVRSIQADFLDSLRGVIQEIFDPEVPFTQTSKTQICENCVFSHLCGR